MCCSVDNGAQLADDGVSDGDAGSRKIVSVLSITPAYLGCAARYVLPGYVVAVLHTGAIRAGAIRAGAIRAGAIRVVADRDKVMDDVIRHIFAAAQQLLLHARQCRLLLQPSELRARRTRKIVSCGAP